jgi:GNAT superfamily N-acetyltransferase
MTAILPGDPVRTEGLAMCEDMIIRWATADDSHSIAEIHIDSWRAAYSQIIPASVLDGLSVEKLANRRREAITQGKEETAVAELGGNILGFATFGECRDDDKPKATTGEVWGIYLRPSHWRNGIGTELLRWVETNLLARNKNEIVLWVLEANAPSRRFYEARGYKEDGATKDLTIGNPLTAIRYAKSLVPA